MTSSITHHLFEFLLPYHSYSSFSFSSPPPPPLLSSSSSSSSSPHQSEGGVAARPDGGARRGPLLSPGGAGVERCAGLLAGLPALGPGGPLWPVPRRPAAGQAPAGQAHLGRHLQLGTRRGIRFFFFSHNQSLETDCIRLNLTATMSGRYWEDAQQRTSILEQLRWRRLSCLQRSPLFVFTPPRSRRPAR